MTSTGGHPHDPIRRLERTLDMRRLQPEQSARRRRSHICEVCENAIADVGGMCRACRSRMLSRVVDGTAPSGVKRASGRRQDDLLSRVPGVLYRASPDRHRRLSFVTDAVTELTGHEAEAFRSGRVGLGGLVHPEDRDQVRDVLGRDDLVRGFDIEYRIVTASGDIRWVSDRGRRSSRSSPHWDEGLLVDVTEKRASYERLLHESRHDPLTGIPNRRTLEMRLLEECARSERSDTPITALIIDADHFKAINDTHGHGTGDQVLVGLADRLRSAIRQYDIIARYGGEEFVVALLGADPETGVMLAERLCRSVADTPVADLAITVSVGCSFWSPGLRPEDLLQRADEALYAAKAAGRNRVSVWGQAPDGGPAAQTPTAA